MKRTRALAVGLLLVVLALPAQALAHAQLVRAEPPPGMRLDRAPGRVRVWFSEALEPGFSSVQVLDASGKPVDNGDSQVTPDDPTSMVVSLPPNLPDGAYTVSWKTLSAVDGHAIRGLFTFGVGTAATLAPAAPAPEVTGLTVLEALPRAVSYLAQTLLLGGFLLAGLVLRGALASAFSRAFRPPGLAAVAVLLIAALVSLVLQAAVASGQGLTTALGASLGPLLFGTRYGVLWLARLALTLALGAVVWKGLGHRRAWQIGALLGAGLLLVNALNSHGAASTEVPELAVVADWLHLAAVSLWVGGLFALAALLWRFDWAPAGQSRVQAIGSCLPRFSGLALASVPLLVLSGIYQSLLQVGSWGALLETVYGQTLLLKIALFVCMLLLGAFHFLVVQPRLARGKTSGATSRFRVTLAVEAGLGVLALIAAGLLTSLAPGWQTYAQEVASRPLEQRATAADLQLALTISPGHPGQNNYTLAVLDSSGQPAANVQKAVLRFTFLDQDLGEVEVPLQPAGDGRYQAQGNELGVAGRWQAVLLVRRQGMEDARTAVRFDLTPAGGNANPPAPLAGLPAPDIRTGLALLTALGGLALAWYTWSNARGRPRRAAPGLAASLLVVVIGVYVGVNSLSGAPTIATANLRNPYPPDQASMARGKQIYDTNCAVCHGESGRGDGPAAATLRPPPADLRVHMAAGHTDGQLFNWITNGVPGTAMPAWKDKLSEEDRWHVINYIRTFATQAAEPDPGTAPNPG